MASNELRPLVDELISLVEKGDILGAFDKFYAENVEMSENLNAPTLGKAANREREVAFVSAIASVSVNKAASSIVEGNRAAIHWQLEATLTDGTEIKYDQIAYQVWENGQIVNERFVYDTGAKA